MTQHRIWLLSSTGKRNLWLASVLFAALGVSAEDNTITVYGDGSSINTGLPLTIGDTGTNNVLIITNATTVRNNLAIIGNQLGASYNFALVSGAGSAWTNADNTNPSGSVDFYVGNTGAFNRLVVTNGGLVFSGNNDTESSTIGGNTNSVGNSVIVTGPDSLWTIRGTFRIGPGSGNQLIIENGGSVSNTRTAAIGDAQFPGPTPSFGDNLVVITDPGSVWHSGNLSGNEVIFGRRGGNNTLIVTNGGRWETMNVSFALEVPQAGSNLVLVTGANSLWTVEEDIELRRTSNKIRLQDQGKLLVRGNLLLGVTSAAVTPTPNNLMEVDGGNLIVTNAGGTATFNVNRGSNVLNSGTIVVDNLVATNGAFSRLVFNGGTLATRSTMIDNGTPTTVGDGAQSATLNLQGGLHSFADGLQISSNATLKGMGTVVGDTTVTGTLAPGDAVGVLSLGHLTLASNATFAVDLNGTTVGTAYDRVEVTGFADVTDSILEITLGYAAVKGDTFLILDNDGSDAVLGEFAGLANLSEFGYNASGTLGYKINYGAGTGNDIVLTVVPEPSTGLLLVLTAVLGLWLRRRR